MNLTIAIAAAIVAIITIVVLIRRNRTLSDENRQLALEKARVDERLAILKEQAEHSDKAAQDRFAVMAAEALQNNSRTLREQSRMQIAELIAPMKANLDDFRKAYTDAYGKESEKRAMLEQQLNELFSLNRTIGEETRRLGDALKGNTSVQGQWGEMVQIGRASCRERV